MKKAISTQPTAANIQAVLDRLAETPLRLAHIHERCSAEQLHRPLRPGERTPAETLAHLLHSEARTAEAITLALLLDEPLLPTVHSERDLGRLLRYDRFSFAELLTYFQFRRTALLRVLAGLSGAQWARTLRQPAKARRESVYWQARALALHELEHVEELEEGLGDEGC